MKLIKANKRGFTLMEIVLVVAIIVILTGLVGGLTISQIKAYKDYGDYVREHGGDNWEKEARLQVDNMLKGNNSGTPGEGEGGGGSPEDPRIAIDQSIRAKYQELIDKGVPESDIHVTIDGDGYWTAITWASDNPISDDPTPADPTKEPTKPADPTTSPTTPPTQTPTTPPTSTPTQAPSNTGIAPSSGVSADGKFKVTSTGANSVHLVNATNSGDTVDFSIANNGGKYTLTITGGNKWVLANNSNGIFDREGIYFWAYNTSTFSVELTPNLVNYFRNTLGFNI